VDPHLCGLAPIRQHAQQERHDAWIAQPVEINQNAELGHH